MAGVVRNVSLMEEEEDEEGMERKREKQARRGEALTHTFHSYLVACRCYVYYFVQQKRFFMVASRFSQSLFLLLLALLALAPEKHNFDIVSWSRYLGCNRMSSLIPTG